jgi:predicted Zn-dependent peptidase
VAVLIRHYADFVTTKGVTPAELSRTVNGNMRQLPGGFETSAAVLGALRSNALYGRPDDYWERLGPRYAAMTVESLDQAARGTIDGSRFVWVIVGDADVVLPQLEGLGLPVEVRRAAAQ